MEHRIGSIQLNPLSRTTLGTDLSVSHLALGAATVHWTTSFLACREFKETIPALSIAKYK